MDKLDSKLDHRLALVESRSFRATLRSPAITPVRLHMIAHPSLSTSRSRLLLALAFVAFVSLGLPDGLLGVAWPSIRAAFTLPLDALGPLLISVAAGYVGSSFASGSLLARMNVGALLAWSCLATAISLSGYALAPNWMVMIACGLLAGIGAGAIDAGLNTYVATYYSARTVNLLHAFYGVGATAGPVLMTGVLMAGHPWQRGYAIVGAAQFALAVSFALTRGRWPAAPVKAEARAAAPIMHTLRLPTAWIGIATFFIYAGIEASAGAWLFPARRGARFFRRPGRNGGEALLGALLAGRLTSASSAPAAPRH
ncbi:MAG: MFS transporter [Gammaproteobacteria bacterium]